MGLKKDFINFNKNDSNKSSTSNNIYRLHYVNFNKDQNEDMLFETFRYYCNLEEEYVFVIVSFIKDLVNREYPKYTIPLHKAILVDALLEFFGFERVIEPVEDENATDLFLITGSIRKFKESNHYDKYINWYIPNITYEDIMLIHEQDKNVKLRKKGRK